MLADFLILLLWFVRVARVWPEVCLMTVYFGGFAMTSRQETAADVRYARQQKRLAKYYWKLSVKTKSETYARICLSTANRHASMLKPFNPPPSAQEVENIFALLDTPAISDACAEYNAIEDIQFEALGELSTLRAEAEATIREHVQLGGLLTAPELTVARLVRGRASMAMRDFPA
jgi:hypothetical protein